MVLGSSIHTYVLALKPEHGPMAAMSNELTLVVFPPVLPAAAVM